MANFYGGPRGLAGASAYEIAKEKGFDGTIDEWLRSLAFVIPAENNLTNGFTIEDNELTKYPDNFAPGNKANQFIMIVSGNENKDNGKVFYSDGKTYTYISDMSAAEPYIKNGAWHLNGASLGVLATGNYFKPSVSDQGTLSWELYNSLNEKIANSDISAINLSGNIWEPSL